MVPKLARFAFCNPRRRLSYRTQKGMGVGIAAAIKAGRVRREELFVTSKIDIQDDSGVPYPPELQNDTGYRRAIWQVCVGSERRAIGLLELYTAHTSMRALQSFFTCARAMPCLEDGPCTRHLLSSSWHAFQQHPGGLGFSMPLHHQCRWLTRNHDVVGI